MVINDVKRWAFVAVPKCGTCSMQLHPGGILLLPAFGGRYVGHPQEGHRMDAPPDYFKFAIVRDPFARVESMHRHFAFGAPFAPEAQDFGLFVRNLPKGKNDGGRVVWNEPQSWWLRQVPGGVDRLLRLEHLSNDLESLGLHEGMLPAVPRLNRHPRLAITWPDELRRIVAEWAHDDLRLLAGTS